MKVSRDHLHLRLHFFFFFGFVQTKNGAHAGKVNPSESIVEVGLETVVLQVHKQTACVKLRRDLLHG